MLTCELRTSRVRVLSAALCVNVWLQNFRKARMGELRKKIPKEEAFKPVKDEALLLSNAVTFDLIAINKVRALLSLL